MAKYLITQSLLSSYLYIFNGYEEDKEHAYGEFLKTLNRETTETTPQMQRGIDFENEVLDYTLEKKAEYSETVEEIGDIVKGGQWQVRAYKDKTICGMNFLLYAKCDVVKAGVIYDIKRVSNYDVGKYFESPQHPMYFECIGDAVKFEYLISDGANLYIEKYTPQETTKIDVFIKNFIEFLKAEKLLDIYCEKWVA